MASIRTSCLIAGSLLLFACSAWGQARFDLAGPKIDVRVTRSGVTLPIASVPNLQPGDQLWLHPDFPQTQSVRYLLIVVFLRGTTNPPPDNWFTRIETNSRLVRAEGVQVTVPAEAQQAILFLAPETGGDFSTLRSAVKGRPGVFVRASQDLTEAGFEQARIERYVAEMKQVAPSDSAGLQQHSDLLARTLNLRPNSECFKRPIDQQYNCLTQSGSQTLLDDGHGQTIVAALSTGTGSDFIQAASYTNLAGGGTYSAYVGAIVDLIRLTSGLHTAQFQYIPAISYPDPQSPLSESLNLRLNTAPSFHNPKSVIVIGLPAVQKSVLPPLRPADMNHVSCLLDPHMVLPVEGAPLVFSTAYAHDLVLHLNVPTLQPGAAQDLPLLADPFLGGVTIDPKPPARKELPLAKVTAANPPAKSAVPELVTKSPATTSQPITGTIRGYWGFDPYTGPTLPLENLPGVGWRIVTSEQTPAVLIAGQPNHLQLTSSGTACIQSILLQPGDSKLEWKFADPAPGPKTPSPTAAGAIATPLPPTVFRAVDLTVNLQHAATPGSIRLAIQQFGQKEPDQLGTKTFAEPARIDALRLHAGDATATLTGTSLEQVKSLTFRDLTYFPPEHKAESGDGSRTTMDLSLSKDGKAPNLKQNDKVVAVVHLEDGRSLEASMTVLAPRPSVSILSKRYTLAVPTSIQLASTDDVPLGAQLAFFLKSRDKFPRTGQIEIANQDESLKTTLSIAAATLILQDSHTLLATFDPLKSFGPSTFGAFRVRALGADGTQGEWLPLATVVRLPAFTEFHCPPVATQQPCQLAGTALYLLDSLSIDATFTDPVSVPEGFVEPRLSMPRPVGTAAGATFYVRLRDDPTATNVVTLPVIPLKPAL